MPLASAARRRAFVGAPCAAIALLLAPDLATAQEPTPSPPPESIEKPEGWWQASNLVHYGAIAAALGAVVGLHELDVPQGSGIGPSFDPAQPAAVLAPTFSDRIGRRHLAEDVGETVPASYVGLAVPIVGAWLLVQEGLPGWIGRGNDGRLVHDTTVGLLESLAFTLAATEALKFSFGRLRPDFQDRVRRHYCNQADSQGVDCTGFSGPPLDTDPTRAASILEDGRRSFPSGHASTAFSLATYASLVTGGHFVWGERATDASRGVGILLQTAAMATAVFVATSRVDDGRHHMSDAMTGAAIGFGMANLAYWRRFDARGLPRGRPAPATATALDTLELGPGPAPLGASLGLRF